MVGEELIGVCFILDNIFFRRIFIMRFFIILELMSGFLFLDEIIKNLLELILIINIVVVFYFLI